MSRTTRSAFFLSIAFTSALAAGSPDTATSPASNDTLFYQEFGTGFIAEARGEKQPLKADQLPGQVGGIRGQAAGFEPGAALSYSSPGNLDKSEGTIAFWVKLPAGGMATQPGPWTLFSEDGPEKAGSTRLKIEYFPGRFIRASIKDPRDSYLYFHGVDQWTAHDWHHVALAWNVEKGALLYVDGLPVDTAWMPAWEPNAFKRFFIGAANESGEESARVAIDELSIHGRELTGGDVREAFLQFGRFSPKVLIQDPFVPAERPGKLSVFIANPGEDAIGLEDLRFALIDPEGSVAQEGELSDQAIDGTQNTTIGIPLKPAVPGTYEMRLSYREADREWEVKSEVRFMVSEGTHVAPPRPAQTSLVAEVNAVEHEPIADFGGTTVEHSPIGAYREGGPDTHDRFALDFEINEPNKPHLAVISYPDDKPRTMEIMLQDFANTIDFQVHSGVFTGEEYPLSNGMLEHRVVFWPRSKRQAFIFMNVADGYPSAVQDIKVYRLHEFSVAARYGEFKGDTPARGTGLYYEDPVLSLNFGTGTDMNGFIEAADRLVDYMRSFGQTELEYPLAWYGGPLYGTRVQPFEPDIEGGQGGNRPHPPGFPLYLLKKLEANSMTFTGGLHIHTLPSLNDDAIVDLDRIEAGDDTVINIRNDGKPWYGHWHGSDPNYNAADPRVMAAVNDIVDEILERYGEQPAFDGISLVIAKPKLFSFGSIESGYNDSNLRRFQQDSGVTIPVYAPDDSHRTARSYEWLMSHPEAKQAWIGWRCRVLYEQYSAMADRLAAVRPDLKLKLNVFVHYTNNTRIAEYLTEPSGVVMREMGIDPELYKDHPNIIFDYTIIPADLRWGREKLDIPNYKVGRTVMTAPEMYASLKGYERSRMTLHDRYWEDPIGKEEPLEGLKELGVNEMVWRASTLNPGSHYSLEPYALALHHLDVQGIKKGGFVVGTFGMEEVLRRFSRAFRVLPAVKFEDVPRASDPVRIRQKVVDGKLYFYVLNTLPEALNAVVKLQESGELLEPATGTISDGTGELELALAPYELRTFVSESATQRVLESRAALPDVWLADLEQRFRGLLKAAKADRELPDRYEPYLALAQEAWEKARYSRIYYLLQEHWASELLGQRDD